MSKELATIEVHADITYDLQAARLTDIFTPEAYALCKEWEFKNLLGRFQIQAPRNVAEDAFSQAEDTQSLTAFAEELAKGQASYIGLYLAWRQRSAKEWEDASLAKDGDGQLSLFTSQKISEDVCQEYEIYGIALSDGEKSLWAPMDDISCITQVLEHLIAQGKRLACMNVKEAIKICTPHLQERFLHYENVYDVAVAEYLLQPLKNTYVAEDLASEYLGISVPGYGETFGKRESGAGIGRNAKGILLLCLL